MTKEYWEDRTKPPLSGDDGAQPAQLILVGQKMAEILGVSHDIARAAKQSDGNFESLRRAYEISESLWAEIQCLPVATIPSIYIFVEKYASTLSEISDSINNNNMAIDIAEDFVQLLDDFLNDIKSSSLKGRTLPGNSPLIHESTGSSHFFQNAQNVAILGGNFTHNAVDIYARKQSDKIVRLLYLNFVILFG
jgi:hypothetical protein